MTKPIEIFDCGICGHYHRTNFYGDCRNDSERFVRDDKDLVSCTGKIKFGSEGTDWIEVDNPDLASEPIHGLDTPDTRIAYELYRSKALNAELLAALIPLEKHARNLANMLGTIEQYGTNLEHSRVIPLNPLFEHAETARAVIAKAKELEL